MMCATGKGSKHGSPSPPHHVTQNLTCRHYPFQRMCSNWIMKLSASVFKHMLPLPSPPTWVKRVHTSPFVACYGYQPLPAAGSTLNRYAAFLARSLSASSIPAYLNAVRILHLEHGLTDPTKNKFHLANKIRRIRRAKGLTVSQKKPITPQILLALKKCNFWRLSD